MNPLGRAMQLDLLGLTGCVCVVWAQERAEIDRRNCREERLWAGWLAGWLTSERTRLSLPGRGRLIRLLGAFAGWLSRRRAAAIRNNNKA